MGLEKALVSSLIIILKICNVPMDNLKKKDSSEDVISNYTHI